MTSGRTEALQCHQWIRYENTKRTNKPKISNCPSLHEPRPNIRTLLQVRHTGEMRNRIGIKVVGTQYVRADREFYKKRKIMSCFNDDLYFNLLSA